MTLNRCTFQYLRTGIEKVWEEDFFNLTSKSLHRWEKGILCWCNRTFSFGAAGPFLQFERGFQLCIHVNWVICVSVLLEIRLSLLNLRWFLHVKVVFKCYHSKESSLIHFSAFFETLCCSKVQDTKVRNYTSNQITW